MSTTRDTLLAFSAGTLCVCLTGCSSFTTVEPLGGRYYEVTYAHTSWEPQADQITLQYRKPDTKWIRGTWTMIWPSVRGVHVTNDVAVFVGYAASKQPDPHDRRATDSRLFAVKAPELPMDITDEVLWRWSNESGENFEKIKKTASIVYPKAKDNGVVFCFASGPDVYLDWDQVSSVMRDVKEKGVVRKDRVWGSAYIEKDFHK